MYGQTGASSYDATHENTNDSSIKTTIDRWYSKYLNTNYGRYVANAIYCNDRKVVTDDSKYKIFFGDDTKVAGTGIGTSDTLYGMWGRIILNTENFSTNPSPTLMCEQVNDRFTLQGTSITTTDGLGGNQDLTYPVGLITADETVLAGGQWAVNNKYYLYTGNWYRTGSASLFHDGSANAFNVSSVGDTPYGYDVNGNGGVRLAISLESGVLKFGDGTAGNPFRMEQ